MSVDELAEGKLRLDRPAPYVARLTSDNPAKRNALDHDILGAIADVVPRLDDARCLLLTATGEVFSAGYDIGGLPRDELAKLGMPPARLGLVRPAQVRRRHRPGAHPPPLLPGPQRRRRHRVGVGDGQ